MSAPSPRTSSSVRSWLVDKLARKRGCSRRSRCTQGTWRQDVKDRGKRSSLSLPEGTEHSGCPQWVHRCSRQRKGSSGKKKERECQNWGSQADPEHSALSCCTSRMSELQSREGALVLLRGQALSFTKFLCKRTQWGEHRLQCFRTADCIKAKDTSFENPEVSKICLQGRFRLKSYLVTMCFLCEEPEQIPSHPANLWEKL